ncbi:SAM-dependent methyltransferase [Methanomicrobiaceae archaeon CYW5]|uniref:class I SAM-dependent methyltransferase n=1 Tax=Methanovulcanius yangii TaxID=1789227 RepID=UPI0029C9F1C9|nr:class I SAM-dependent methyltransferase [Methanovulcanius yangii]MBT8506947.1 SAM-dependent methyltransferase [Methanovulcanius yangii]
MDISFLLKMHEGLPRQGPGSNECTRKAFSMLKNLPEHPEILDIGCGSGMQTVELARICPEGHVTAVDIHPPFLDDLARRAEAAGVGERITTVRASMDDLPFGDGSFDVLWAESSIFIVGFGEGLSLWKRLLRPGGYACITEAVWFTDEPSPAAVGFWNDCYPAITSVEETCAKAEDAGYEVVATFRLPGSVWWDYYTPLEKRLPELKKAAVGDPVAESFVAFSEGEMAVYREHGDEYGYAFFVLRRR